MKNYAWNDLLEQATDPNTYIPWAINIGIVVAIAAILAIL